MVGGLDGLLAHCVDGVCEGYGREVEEMVVLL